MNDHSQSHTASSHTDVSGHGFQPEAVVLYHQVLGSDADVFTGNTINTTTTTGNWLSPSTTGGNINNLPPTWSTTTITPLVTDREKDLQKLVLELLRCLAFDKKDPEVMERAEKMLDGMDLFDAVGI